MPEPSVPPSFKPVDIGPIGEAIAAQVAAFHEARLRQFGQQDAYFCAAFTMAEAANALRNIAGDAAAREVVRTLGKLLDAMINFDHMTTARH